MKAKGSCGCCSRCSAGGCCCYCDCCCGSLSAGVRAAENCLGCPGQDLVKKGFLSFRNLTLEKLLPEYAFTELGVTSRLNSTTRKTLKRSCWI